MQVLLPEMTGGRLIIASDGLWAGVSVKVLTPLRPPIRPLREAVLFAQCSSVRSGWAGEIDSILLNSWGVG